MQEECVLSLVYMPRDKLLDKMRQNPLNDWRIENVQTIAKRYDLKITHPRGGGSHVTLRHNSGVKLTIPAHRRIKPVYIRKLIALIDLLEENHE